MPEDIAVCGKCDWFGPPDEAIELCEPLLGELLDAGDASIGHCPECGGQTYLDDLATDEDHASLVEFLSGCDSLEPEVTKAARIAITKANTLEHEIAIMQAKLNESLVEAECRVIEMRDAGVPDTNWAEHWRRRLNISTQGDSDED